MWHEAARREAGIMKNCSQDRFSYYDSSSVHRRASKLSALLEFIGDLAEFFRHWGKLENRKIGEEETVESEIVVYEGSRIWSRTFREESNLSHLYYYSNLQGQLTSESPKSIFFWLHCSLFLSWVWKLDPKGGPEREREKFSKYSSNWSNPKCSDCLTLGQCSQMPRLHAVPRTYCLRLYICMIAGFPPWVIPPSALATGDGALKPYEPLKEIN